MNRQTVLSEFGKMWKDDEELTITDFVLDLDNFQAYFTCVGGEGKLVDESEAVLVRRVRSETFGGYVRLWRRGDPGSTWTPSRTYDQRTPSVPLLKSHLQKSIRRCMSNEAYYGTILLLVLDRNALLRRLLIIMIEDCCLNAHAPLICWLMMAGPMVPVTDKIFRIVTGFVHSLCLESRVFRTVQMPSAIPLPCEIRNRLTNVTAAAVLSLLIRKEYGGMKGDMRLLGRAAEYYYHVPEFISQPTIAFEKWQPPMFVNMDYLVIPCAYDYHCFPHMVKSIASKNNMTEADVKTIIWTGASGLNFRKSHTIKECQHAKSCPEYRKVISQLKKFRENQERRRISSSIRSGLNRCPCSFPA